MEKKIGKKEIFEILDEKNIAYERHDHIPVFTVAEADEVSLPDYTVDSKNLLLRDKKTDSYFLIIMGAHKALDLKALKTALGAKSLSFAQPDRLMEYFGLIPGAVSPFGALNDKEHKVLIIFDEELRGASHFAAHPNENDCTLLLAVSDIEKLLTDFGARVLYIPL